ncbi:unnamed protein product [Protopolystoma xenopodis]|uniref:SAM domain-containing protein n=1 Tax=Protopolystoma xenopodis TaxID=117903 RepID=A0A3S4ZRH7_9PLAT|nr:unnamed protein product [Protopolystoma xenopodis]
MMLRMAILTDDAGETFGMHHGHGSTLEMIMQTMDSGIECHSSGDLVPTKHMTPVTLMTHPLYQQQHNIEERSHGVDRHCQQSSHKTTSHNLQWENQHSIETQQHCAYPQQEAQQQSVQVGQYLQAYQHQKKQNQADEQSFGKQKGYNPRKLQQCSTDSGRNYQHDQHDQRDQQELKNECRVQLEEHFRMSFNKEKQEQHRLHRACQKPDEKQKLYDQHQVAEGSTLKCHQPNQNYIPCSNYKGINSRYLDVCDYCQSPDWRPDASEDSHSTRRLEECTTSRLLEYERSRLMPAPHDQTEQDMVHALSWSDISGQPNCKLLAKTQSAAVLVAEDVENDEKRFGPGQKQLASLILAEEEVMNNCDYVVRTIDQTSPGSSKCHIFHQNDQIVDPCSGQPWDWRVKSANPGTSIASDSSFSATLPFEAPVFYHTQPGGSDICRCSQSQFRDGRKGSQLPLKDSLQQTEESCSDEVHEMKERPSKARMIYRNRAICNLGSSLKPSSHLPMPAAASSRHQAAHQNCHSQYIQDCQPAEPKQDNAHEPVILLLTSNLSSESTDSSLPSTNSIRTTAAMACAQAAGLSCHGVSSWRPSQVAKWLRFAGMDHLTGPVLSRQITGSKLVRLHRRDLQVCPYAL